MTFIQPVHAPSVFLPSPPTTAKHGTKLPSLFGRDLPTGHFCDWPDETVVDLRPITTYHENNSEKTRPAQLPSIHAIVASPPLPRSPPSSLSAAQSSTSSWPSPCSFVVPFDEVASRKSSIASLLNFEPSQRPTCVKRGRPRHISVRSKKHRYHPSSPSQPPSRHPHQQHRSQPSPPSPQITDSRRASKGLRHFSKQVCDKVEEHGVTTYNQVADELAVEMCSADGSANVSGYDQKNIRRRVYDALNVLMAMGIVEKDKKEIRWLGIPTEFQCDSPSPLEQQIASEEQRQAQLTASIRDARASVSHALQRHLQLRHLAWRNQRQPSHANKIPLPFFAVLSTGKCDVDVSRDRRQAVITISEAATENDTLVCDDASVLQALGFNQMSTRQVSCWLPQQAWRQYLSMQSLDDTMCVVQPAFPAVTA